MEKLLATIAEISLKAKELRGDPIFGALGHDGERLRNGFHDLQTVIETMDRQAAELYKLLKGHQQSQQVGDRETSQS